eukprot:TRINITY_DN1384_c0_g1_i1.p1 TRINITY_DN1384_c0_g1~~TRINITY_DN1384_c0_g1_i1.p1  ORF type:complete len:658 (+),score=171.35 TRINITY_DN1384_c0_g1_i1:114-2087(+)
MAGGGSSKPMDVGEPHKFDPDFKGPVDSKQRKCRDLLFLFLFLGFWVGMIYVASKGVEEGNPRRLIYPMDAHGNLCNVDNTKNTDLAVRFNYKGKKHLWWPSPLSTDQEDSTFCVEECPAADDVGETWSFTGLKEDGSTQQWSKEVLETFYGSGSNEMLRYCIPKDTGNANVDNVISKGSRVLDRMFGDLSETWLYIMGSAFAAIVIGFVWTIFLRLFARILVWTTIWTTLALMIAGTALVLKKGIEMEEEGTDMEIKSVKTNANVVKGFGYTLGALTVLLLCLIIWLRKRISLAVRIIQEGGRAIHDMPLLMFFPFVLFALAAGFVVYWIVIALYLASAGTIEQEGTSPIRTVSYDKTLKGMIAYHFFGLLWTTEILLALGKTTIAGAVACWYFCRDKKKGLPKGPISDALGRTLKYNFGSLALGSLIIAIVRFIRFTVRYIAKKAKKAKSKAVKTIFCCAECCLACVERFLRFINTHAYIQIAIYGKSFCTSARNGFMLLMRNVLRIAAINILGDFFLFLGKLVVVGGAGLLCFVLIKDKENISSPLFPVLVTMIFAWAVGSAFMGVYETAIDTIFQCFCEDSERNDGSAEHPFFMSDSLRQFVAASAQRRKKKMAGGKAVAAAAAPAPAAAIQLTIPAHADPNAAPKAAWGSAA